MSDHPVSGIFSERFHIDQSGNLTTATPVDIPPAGQVYKKTFKAPQDGCLRAMCASCETTPAAGNGALVIVMTKGGTEVAGAGVSIAEAATADEETFKNGEFCFVEGDLIGVSVTQTGTIDAAVNEIDVNCIFQLGKSNL
ncbi:MAG: hypothetical protein WC455_20995 [Dehalococcoidia bacterium]|jgi:hypothetical protein